MVCFVMMDGMGFSLVHLLSYVIFRRGGKGELEGLINIGSWFSQTVKG